MKLLSILILTLFDESVSTTDYVSLMLGVKGLREM
jgi:hypothetical protein